MGPVKQKRGIVAKVRVAVQCGGRWRSAAYAPPTVPKKDCGGMHAAGIGVWFGVIDFLVAKPPYGP